MWIFKKPLTAKRFLQIKWPNLITKSQVINTLTKFSLYFHLLLCLVFWKALNLNWRLLERSLKEKHDKILDGCGTNAPARLTVPMSLPRVLSHFPPHPCVNFMQMCVHPVVKELHMSAQTSFITRQWNVFSLCWESESCIHSLGRWMAGY